MKIAITGANSAVGKALLRQLSEQNDLQAVAAVRSERAAATLPSMVQVTPSLIDYRHVDSLIAAFAGATTVVHLAGILIEGPETTYQTANVDVTRAVLDAAAATDVQHLVLVSTLDADPQATNRYYRSKGDAEHLVHESALSATIIRTPILLGPETAGARALLHLAAKPSVRILGGGHHSLRPLDIDDLSIAILGACHRRPPGVRVHDLAGPTTTTYRDLILETGRHLGTTPTITSLPIGIARLAATVGGLVKRGGMTPTVIDVITADEVVPHNADGDLGVTLTSLSTTISKLARHETITS